MEQNEITWLKDGIDTIAANRFEVYFTIENSASSNPPFPEQYLTSVCCSIKGVGTDKITLSFLNFGEEDLFTILKTSKITAMELCQYTPNHILTRRIKLEISGLENVMLDQLSWFENVNKPSTFSAVYSVKSTDILVWRKKVVPEI